MVNRKVYFANQFSIIALFFYVNDVDMLCSNRKNWIGVCASGRGILVLVTRPNGGSSQMGANISFACLLFSSPSNVVRFAFLAILSIFINEFFLVPTAALSLSSIALN
ncbi:hypothetical protein FGO68_gene7847 [Halteria grandinella]|uniref:Uncharacterized protein n=1 Tax=Halteria grandinella TaxID=5974 RepID=A0A8J8NAE5_HALGN|nr:hypothetical protein FGO68_gene7847 [Halteria grandinella]